METDNTASHGNRCVSTRYTFAIMGFIGMTIVYSMRTSITVAIVAMVDTTAVQNTKEILDNTCPSVSSSNSSESTVSHTGFAWDEQIQAIVLGSYYYGYLFSQIPGGYLAVKFGGKIMCLSGVLIISVFTLLSPGAAEIHVALIILCRTIIGVGGGILLTSTHTLLGQWSPPTERSKMSSLVYSGTQTGSIVGTLLTGPLCDSDFLGGWPSSFYVFGVLGIVWVVVAYFVIYDSPAVHPRISKEERVYIESRIGNIERKESSPIPWKAIFTSFPVWAIVVCQLAQGWLTFIIISELPTYLSDVYHIDITTTGVVSAISCLVCWISLSLFSWIADFLRDRKYLSITAIRKIFQTISFVGPIAALIGLYFMGCDFIVAVVLFILAIGSNGAVFSGYFASYIDLSPTYAGAIMGVCSFFGNIGYIIAPIAVGSILNTNPNRTQWGLVFITGAVCCLIAAVVYLIFGSSAQQEWGDTPQQEKTAKPKTTQISDAVIRVSEFHLGFVNIQIN